MKGTFKRTVAALLILSVIMSTFVFGNAVVTAASTKAAVEEGTYEPMRTMLHYKRTKGYNKLLVKVSDSQLKADTSYTVSFAIKFVTGSLDTNGLVFALYGVDSSLSIGNSTGEALNATENLYYSSIGTNIFTSGANQNYSSKKTFTFSLSSEQLTEKTLYLGFDLGYNACDFYLSEFSLYETEDSQKVSLLNIGDYETDVAKWRDMYGKAIENNGVTIPQYVEYNPSKFKTALHFKYSGTSHGRIGIAIPSIDVTDGIIKKGVRYTISYDFYFVTRGFDYGICPYLFANTGKGGLGNPWYERVYSTRYHSKTLFEKDLPVERKTKSGKATYSFTISSSEELRKYYMVGFYIRKDTTDFTSVPEFYISNLTLTEEGSSNNLLAENEYTYSLDGNNWIWGTDKLGDKSNVGGTYTASNSIIAESNYVEYGTGDGNADGEVDIRDLVMAAQTVTDAEFNPMIDTDVDRTVDQGDVENIRYRILGLGVTVRKPAEPIEPENPEDTLPFEEIPSGNVTATKTASKSTAQTVLPGETVSYSVELINNEATAQDAVLFEKLPDGTELVSGDCEDKNGYIAWSGNIGAGERKTVNYTLKIDKNYALCGTVLEGSKTQVNNNFATGYDLYVERTASSKEDQRFISNGIRALKDSTYRDMTLVKWIYQIAFSKTATTNLGETAEATLSGITNGTATEQTLKMVAPTLYGGTAVTGAIDGIKGEPCQAVMVNDLIVGDLLFVKNVNTVKNYIYDKDGFVDLSAPMSEVDTDEVLENLTSSTVFAVFRPTIDISRDYIIDSEQEELELTEQQKAILATAESYILRGEKIQYDAQAFGGYSGAAERMTAGEKSPEDYTSNEWGYSNCAGFTYDMYFNALGVDINYNGTSLYYTVRLENYADDLGIRKYNFTRTLNQTHSVDEMQTVKQEILNELKPCDIILVRRTDGTGHALLYAGNGTIIHSTGSSYDTNTPKEIAEPTIRYHRVEDYLFTEGSKGYIFGNLDNQTKQVDCFMIIRPLSKSEYNVQVPEKTVNRVNNMQGIMAEKISSHNSAITVNKGEEMTFTFKLYNTNDTEKTVEICDTVPTNTTYVSGAEAKDGNNLSWTVTIPANSRREVSYNVKVNEDAVYGDFVESGSTVGGIEVNCLKVYIKRSLTVTEQQAIISAVSEIKANGTTNEALALVNEIYNKALGVENIFESTDFMTVTAGVEGVFSSEGLGKHENGQLYALNSSGKYFDMLAPTLFGGRRYYSTTANGRTFLARKHNLMVGDILLRRTTSAYQYYLYVGDDKFLSLANGMANDSCGVNYRLETCLGSGYYYAVLRPSFSLQ